MSSSTIVEGVRQERTPLSRIVIASIIWGEMLIASALPEIIWFQFAPTIPAWFSWFRIALLLGGWVLALFWRPLQPLRAYFLVLAAFFLGWEMVIPFLLHIPVITTWAQILPLGLQLLMQGLIRLIPGVFMLALVLLRRVGRKSLFLRKGNLRERLFPTSRWPLLKSLTWIHLGIVFLVVAGILLPLYLFSTMQVNIAGFSKILLNAPIILMCAVLNTSNEEFEFRSVMLSSLQPAVGSQQALWLTSLHFGLEHYYGQPSGIIGVLMAGFAGFLWGASVLRTKGIRWAWATHLIQDIVIFSLVISAP